MCYPGLPNRVIVLGARWRLDVIAMTMLPKEIAPSSVSLGKMARQA
jgi:hypothetical protein